ncbi:MAG TPA: hypothetical protein VGL38_08280 [bacterium]|jgi:hypothetical protein
MSKHWVKVGLVVLAAAMAVMAMAAPKAAQRMVNVYQQLAPWRAYYNSRTDWPRAHGYKPFKRYEWDVMQRGFPDGNIPAGAYWEAFQTRGRMRHHSLDEAWVNLGPYNHGGRARVIRFDPRNANIMYAGGVSGGIFKSIDAGESWHPLTDNLPNLSVGCFELDPSHPDTMYLGTGEGYFNGDAIMGIGLLKSTNGGQTWATTGLSYQYNQGESILRLSIDPRDGQIVMASTNDGLYRSTDGAASFTMVRSGDIKELKRDPQDPDILLCAPGNPGGSGVNGIYRSTDNGISWTRTSTGLPSIDQIGRIVLAFYAANSQIVYAGICGTWSSNGSQMVGIYRSMDNGQNWTQMSQTGANHYASQGWYDMALAVKPDQPNTVLSAGLDTWRSTNSGLAWTQVSHWDYNFGNPAYVHADHHEIVFHPTNANEVWQVTDGGIFKSTNAGSTWLEKSNGFVTFQYYAMGNATLDTALAYGGTQDNGTFRYHGSQDFAAVFGGDGGYSVVDFTNDNTVYAEWQGGHRSRSDDGGNNWSDINPGISGDGAWVCPMVLDPFDHLTIYTTTTDGNVWKSPNQGRNSSWATVGQTLGGTMQVIVPSPVQQGRIYLATDNSVYRLDPDATQWVNITAGLPGAYVTRIVPDPVDANTVFVTLSGFGHGHVYKSTQAGSNWVNISGNLPDVPYQDVVVDVRDHNTLYVGGDIGAYYSPSGGSDWQIMGEGLPAVRIDDMDMQPVTGVLRAATHGRGMWEVPTGSARLALLYPNGGEVLQPGQAVGLRWSGTSFGGNVRLEINRSYPSATWETLFASTPNDGTENWTVTGPDADHVRFRITHVTQATLTDSSNADSRIVSPSLHLVWPNGGTVFTGLRDTVRFARQLVTDPLKLELNRDYPNGTWLELSNNITADSTAMWIVQLPASNNARLRVTSMDRPELTDMSDADFVLRAPQMTLSAPNGGEQLAAGTPYNIQWSAPEHRGTLKLQLNRDYPGGTWETINSNTANDGEFTWVPSGLGSTHCRVRVSTVFDQQSFVESAADFTITSLAADSKPALPKEFALHEPYPNPFNPTTVVAIDLPVRMKVKARVFNRLGQQVAMLKDGFLEPGSHDMVFDASMQPSGVYFIRVEAAGKMQILKVALVK